MLGRRLLYALIDFLKGLGTIRGRPENAERNAGIVQMLEKGISWSKVQAATGCSRATVAKLAKRVSA